VTYLQRIRQVKYIIDIMKINLDKRRIRIRRCQITTGRVLRGIVNHSYGKSQLDSDWNKSQMDNSERNIEDKRLSGTNLYEVLENYDEVENEEIGTKSTT